MKIHEYQAAELFRQYGVPAAEGRVAQTPEEAQKHAAALGGAVVVKAQVHAGGRGKAGGVKLAKTPAEAREKGAAICGMKLVSPQTGPAGGVEIEETAAKHPEKIVREHFRADEGLQGFQARKIAFALGLTGPQVNEGA